MPRNLRVGIIFLVTQWQYCNQAVIQVMRKKFDFTHNLKKCWYIILLKEVHLLSPNKIRANIFSRIGIQNPKLKLHHFSKKKFSKITPICILNKTFYTMFLASRSGHEDFDNFQYFNNIFSHFLNKFQTTFMNFQF